MFSVISSRIGNDFKIMFHKGHECQIKWKKIGVRSGLQKARNINEDRLKKIFLV